MECYSKRKIFVGVPMFYKKFFKIEKNRLFEIFLISFFHGIDLKYVNGVCFKL